VHLENLSDSNRAGTRSTTGTNPDPIRSRPADEVRDDEVVPGEALGGDDLDLVGGALANLVGEPRWVSLAAEVRKVLEK
jgi:hypothetical protein